MKVKYVDKHYLYLRDHGQCHFCGKALVFGKMSIDHYLPRSAGGTDDVFNLVTSCKRCNCQKQSHLPDDIERIHIQQMIHGIQARKIGISSQLHIGYEPLIQMVLLVKKAYASGEWTCFESATHRFYICDNKVMRIKVLSNDLLDVWEFEAPK